MKKVLMVATVAILAFTNVNAQEVKFGVKVGVNVASISGDDAENEEGRTSFHIGGVTEIMISENFSIQPELMYSSQGYSFASSETFGGDTYDYEETGKLDYINLPIMAKYYVAEGFSLEAGPQIGFLMSAKLESYDSEDGSYSDDIKELLKDIDFGLGVGLGFKMDNGLNFAARYNIGLSSISEDDEYSIQNNVLQVSVGFMF